MNDVPIANQREDQQQKGDKQQTGGLRGINRMPAVLMGRTVLALSFSHDNIVRPAGTGGVTASNTAFTRGCKLFRSRQTLFFDFLS